MINDPNIRVRRLYRVTFQHKGKCHDFGVIQATSSEDAKKRVIFHENRKTGKSFPGYSLMSGGLRAERVTPEIPKSNTGDDKSYPYNIALQGHCVWCGGCKPVCGLEYKNHLVRRTVTSILTTLLISGALFYIIYLLA